MMMVWIVLTIGRKEKCVGKKAVIKIGSDDMDDSRDTISDSDSLVEECKILCICTNLFTCALHYSKFKADRLKLLVAHMDSSAGDVEIVGSGEHIQNPTCQTALASKVTATD